MEQLVNQQVISQEEQEFFSKIQCLENVVVVKPIIDAPSNIIVPDKYQQVLIKHYAYVMASGVKGINPGDKIIYKISSILTDKGQLLKSHTLMLDEFMTESDPFSGMYIVLDIINIIGTVHE